MDIQVSSNFERFLFHLLDDDAEQVKSLMKTFEETGRFQVCENTLKKARDIVFSVAVSDGETLKTIKKYYESSNYILCPHSAVGVKAAHVYLKSEGSNHNNTLICLATAHYGKFNDTIQKALKYSPPLPNRLDTLRWKRFKKFECGNSLPEFKHFIENHINNLAVHDEGLFAPFTIKVPCTTANLGCGFDSFGLALDMHLIVHVAPLPGDAKFEIVVTGEESDLPTDESNLIWRVANSVVSHYQKALPPLKITINNPIPLSRGLGSSACAVVTGVLIANCLGDLNLNTNELLAHMCKIEGHPDNITPALVGGFTSSASFDDPENQGFPKVIFTNNAVHPAIKAIIFVPNYKLDTEESRSVLPSTYSRRDTVHNLQRIGLLINGMASARADLVSLGMDDKIHQPYRAPLIPGLNSVLSLSGKLDGMLGVCISGSGSTIIAFVTHNIDAITAAVTFHLGPVNVKVLSISHSGSLIE